MKRRHEIAAQRDYYAQTAQKYNEMHGEGEAAIDFSMHVLFGLLSHLNVKSVLDIGSGTGRTLIFARENYPHLKVMGVEPVPELRQVAYSQGVSTEALIDGDALALPFKDGSFDLVCEFAVLHHIKNPDLAISEMLRVASKAIFISDSNNFGQGGAISRALKQVLNTFRLWPIADLVKTRGRGYIITEGDGLSYSYSVFSNYDQIRASCDIVHLLNTSASGKNLYRTASSVALLGIKK